MKYVLSIFILVIGYKNSNAQNAYYDAKKLAKWESLADTMKQAKSAEHYAILLRYSKNFEILDQNYPFLKGVKKEIKEAYTLKKIKETNKATIIKIIFTANRNRTFTQSDLNPYIDEYENNLEQNRYFERKEEDFFQMVG